jgi:hypothetical protein
VLAGEVGDVLAQAHGQGGAVGRPRSAAAPWPARR